MTVVAESSDAFLSEVNFLNTVEQTIWRVFFSLPRSLSLRLSYVYTDVEMQYIMLGARDNPVNQSAGSVFLRE